MSNQRVDEPMRPAPSRLFNGLAAFLALLIGIVCTAVVLGLLECGARALKLKTPFVLIPTYDNCLERNRLFGLEYRPKCTANSRGTLMRTNSLGLRGEEVRDNGSRRILAMGDSCTWGWRVPQSETYPAILQRLLDAQPLQHHYQVINAGMPGMTSYHGLLYLRERGLALKPDIIIIGYAFNDASRTGDVEFELAQAQRFYRVLKLDDTLLDYSVLYRWLRAQGVSVQKRQEPRVSLDKFRRNMTSLVELSRGHGAKVMLLDYTRHGGRTHPYVDVVNQLARELTLPVVRYDGPRIDMVHPTAAGYHLLADDVFAHLRDEGYVE